MPNILQISHNVYPLHDAGVELATWELSKLMRDQLGATVYIYSLTQQGIFGVHDRWQRMVTKAFTLSEMLTLSKPDLILVQHLKGHPSTIQSEIISSGIPYIVFLHDYWYMCKRVTLYSLWGQRCHGPNLIKCLACVGPIHDTLETSTWWQVNKTFLSEASHVVAASLRVKYLYEKNGLQAASWSVIPPMYEIPPRVTSHSYNSVLYLGGRAQVKGFQLFGKALSHISDKLQISLGGNGTTNDIVKDLPKQHEYRVLGHISRVPALENISGSNVVCCPSVGEESYGRVATESIVLGTPLVVTKVGGYPERILNSHTTKIVDPNPHMLAEAIKSLVSSTHPTYEKNPTQKFNLKQITLGRQRIVSVVNHYLHARDEPYSSEPPVDYQDALRWNNLLETHWNKLGVSQSSIPAVPTLWAELWQ